MSLFGEDPKDTLIASLQGEIEYLRGQVKELQGQILALTSAGAYRLTHEAAPEPPGTPPPLSPMQLRDAEPSKENLRTVAELQAQWDPGRES